MTGTFYEPIEQGFIIRIKAYPGAKREGFTGIIETEGQLHFLKVSISTPPEDGKANKALIQFMAKAWKLSPSQFELIKGQTHRLKIVKLEILSTDEVARMTTLFKTFK
ncbi:MAG: DUF167 domain-containing protein [Alphaproteobacteria bacterium]|nr:DUF167 domain-containing protein [Alphaproteobacteria bacterium]